MKYLAEYEDDIQKSIKYIDLKPLYNKSVLITGVTGLIGSAIVDMLICLNENYKYHINIFAASRNIEKIKKRFSSFSEKDYFYALQYDATKQFSFDKTVDYIICGASNAHPESIGNEPVETMLANIYGLNGLLEYAKNHAVKRVLYISSSEIYGRKNNNELYKEDEYGYVNFLNPRACYPSSKRAAETLCSAYLAEYGIDSVIVRPGHIYGPTQKEDDSRASAQFLRSAILKRDIVMKSSGAQIRSYCHCLDCATAIITVLLKGERGEAYNISNIDSIITIREFAEICAEKSGTNIIFENPVDSEKASYNMMECSALDSKKLEGLGWKGKWGAYDGIEETILILKEMKLRGHVF